MVLKWSWAFCGLIFPKFQLNLSHGALIQANHYAKSQICKKTLYKKLSLVGKHVLWKSKLILLVFAKWNRCGTSVRFVSTIFYVEISGMCQKTKGVALQAQIFSFCLLCPKLFCWDSYLNVSYEFMDGSRANSPVIPTVGFPFNWHYEGYWIGCWWLYLSWVDTL